MAAKVCAIPELLENILKNFNQIPRELYKLQRVNSTFRDVILESSTLQYSMGLKYNSDTCLTGVRTIDDLFHPFLAEQDKFDFWPFVRDDSTMMVFERPFISTDYASAGVVEFATSWTKNALVLHELPHIIKAVEQGSTIKDIGIWFGYDARGRTYRDTMPFESWLELDATRGSWRDVYVTSLPVGIHFYTYDFGSLLDSRFLKSEPGKPVTLGCLVDALKQVSLP